LTLSAFQNLFKAPGTCEGLLWSAAADSVIDRRPDFRLHL